MFEPDEPGAAPAETADPAGADAPAPPADEQAALPPAPKPSSGKQRMQQLAQQQRMLVQERQLAQQKADPGAQLMQEQLQQAQQQQLQQEQRQESCHPLPHSLSPCHTMAPCPGDCTLCHHPLQTGTGMPTLLCPLTTWTPVPTLPTSPPWLSLK